VKLAIQRTTTAVAVFATAGISGLFWGATPAFAASPCGTGTLISSDICQQTFTATSATNFTAPASTTKLEALLVGGGGAGNVKAASAPTTSGYALGGGGGQVTIVDFTGSVGSATPLVVTVGAGGASAGDPGDETTVTGGPAAIADGGAAAGDTTGGSSGANTGASISDSKTPPTYYGGGAGAGPTGSTTTIDGGAGLTVSTSFSGDALFGSDTACYGGGGAALESPTVGTASCGGNAPKSKTATSYPTVKANTGGGGAASLAAHSVGHGSSGVVVFRWFAPAYYTLTFAADGHGATLASQAVAPGTTPTRPTNPTASDWVFKGWYTDPGLTTPADFSTPLTTSTTFYAKWDPLLATTGGGPNQAELPIAIGTLAIGAALTGTAFYRRKRRVAS
jgi:uncharacterized repeat protein (TIGR02543 family)